MGAMPPWYVEKDIGIQHYKQDPSLTDEDLAKIQAWVDNGAPEGTAADLTVELDAEVEDGWRIEPDLIVSSAGVFLPGGSPDWWGEIEPIDIPLEQDRYVKAVEIRRSTTFEPRVYRFSPALTRLGGPSQEPGSRGPPRAGRAVRS